MSARSMPSTLFAVRQQLDGRLKGKPSGLEATAGRFAGFCKEADQPSKGPALERNPSQARLARVADGRNAGGLCAALVRDLAAQDRQQEEAP